MMDILNELINQVQSNFGSLKDFLSDQFLNNDFFVGIAVPAIFTGIIYTFRNFFSSIWYYIKRLATSDLTINTDSGHHYAEMANMVYSRHLITLFQRSFVLNSNHGSQKPKLGIGYGYSLGRYKYYPMIIKRTIEESDSDKFKEIITVTFLGSRRRAAKHFMDDFNKHLDSLKKGKNIRFYTSTKYGDWEYTAKKPKRPIDTVIIPDEDKSYIIDKLDKFFASEDDYKRKGIPYNLGVLLYGEPGTGKSSLIHALASRYEKKIYYQKGSELELSHNMNDGFLIFEDIDASAIKSSRDDNEKITNTSFSDILNSIDGPLTPHGLVTIATTNHIDKLDPALVRHGRFDVKVELGKMKWPEWCRLCELMERENPIIEFEFKDIVPSKARYILTYYDDETIIKEFKGE